MNATTQRKIGAAILAVCMVAITAHTHAAGLLIADGGLGGVLEIREHRVQVTINNGIAVTKVEQVFHNTEKRQVEALYTFPVPRGASVANFSMWIGGKEMVGEVLEKKRAREIYNSYKAVRRDPGLLEQADYRTFEMRIFPIAPDTDQKVQITYYQELDTDHDSATYVYPLATATRPGADTRINGTFSFSIDVRSAVPIMAMASPSHSNVMVAVTHSESYRQSSFEMKSGDLAKDVVVAYSTSRPHSGIDVVAQKAGRDDGYFYMTLTAGKDVAALDMGMDYVFVLDVSGSMADDRKLELSRNAALAFAGALGTNDRFEVITFNMQPSLVFRKLELFSPTALQQARSHLEAQSALGGTVLNTAINTAYKYHSSDRQLNVVLLSDGLAEQNEQQTLFTLIKERPGNTRVFCICVGNDVNMPLMEQLAQDSGGIAAFVSHGDDFARQALAFRRKLMRPALANITVAVDGVRVSDIEPRTVPNLYFGAPVRLYGRYSGGGTATVTVKGDVLGKPVTQTVELALPEKAEDNPEIERMWAWHRIDNLLKAADRSGSRDSVLGEVIDLGERFSIVTEYTSFLVLENDAEYVRWKIERRNTERVSRDRAAQDKVQKELELLRNKAVANIGPVEDTPKVTAAAPSVQTASARPQASAPSPVPTANSRRPAGNGADFNFGTGPVGILFGAATMLIRFMKKEK